MKMDKETFIKHRFWFLLGAVVPLVLISVCVLSFGFGPVLQAKQKEFDDAVKGVKAINSPKNQTFLDPVAKKENTLQAKKNKVWEQAWKAQGDIITWPPEMQRDLGNKYLGEFIDEVERRRYARLYPSYIAEVEKEFTQMIAPVEFKGGFNGVIRTVSQWDDNRPPLLEELYLAQEDISVQRELLKIVKDTLDTLKKFHPVEGAQETAKVGDAKAGDKKEAKPAGSGKVLVFRNPNWEITLSLDQNEKKQLIVSGPNSKIKNINPSKRTLAVDVAQFQIVQGQAGAVPFRVPAEYLLWNQECPLHNDVLIDKFNKNAPVQVEQVFDWQSSPIKRIDALAMGYNSHRTSNYALKTRPMKDTLQVTAGQAGSTGIKGYGAMLGGPNAASAPGSAPGLGGGANTPPPGAAGEGDAAAAAEPETPNRLSRYRYLDVRPQVRWMPIGLVLVIDQSAMQDVLAAIANSRLRIQTTQVSWSHVANVRSEKGETKGGAGLETAGAKSKKGGPDEGGPRGGSRLPGAPMIGYGPPAPGGMATMGPFGSGQMRRSLGDQDDPNLIELSVYGIASLYERYPPQPPAAPTTEPAKPPAGK
ncbi:MAG: hypothetical protein ACJ8FY_08530 [Gemmataceae bacterium]